VTDPLGYTTTFGYGTTGNLTSMTDPLSHAHDADLQRRRAAADGDHARITTTIPAFAWAVHPV
jgi:YD repeat-containing protein